MKRIMGSLFFWKGKGIYMTDVGFNVPGCEFANSPDMRTVPLTALSEEACASWCMKHWRERTVDDWRKSTSRVDLKRIREEVPETLRKESFRHDHETGQEVYHQLRELGMNPDTMLLAVLDDASLKRLERVL